MSKRILVVLSVLILVIIGAAIANPIDNEPEFDTVSTEPAMYYRDKDIADTFSYYLGYIPKMEMNYPEKTATMYLRNGITLDVPLKHFENGWYALEVPGNEENPFKKWGTTFSYSCFNRDSEVKLGGYIFYDEETAEKILGAPLTWNAEESIVTIFNVSYTLSARNDFCFAADNGDWLINARVLSQALYEHELANTKTFISLGNIFQ